MKLEIYIRAARPTIWQLIIGMIHIYTGISVISLMIRTYRCWKRSPFRSRTVKSLAICVASLHVQNTVAITFVALTTLCFCQSYRVCICSAECLLVRISMLCIVCKLVIRKRLTTCICISPGKIAWTLFKPARLAWVLCTKTIL